MAVRVLCLLACVAIFLQAQYCLSYMKHDYIDCGDIPCTCFDQYNFDLSGTDRNLSANGTAGDLVPKDTNIDCKSKNLTEVPTHMLSNVTDLRLSHNRIKHLPGRQLQNFSDLYYLDLGFNDISRIEEEAFWGLSRLTILLLNRNSLSELPKGLFSHLINIRFLQLGFNNLKRIPDLNGLPYLTNLAVHFNEIEDVTVDNLPKGMPLQNFVLIENKMRHFPLSLASFFEEHMATYGYLTVVGNPWVCDCQMADLKRVWTSHPRFLTDSFYCDRPQRLKGKNLWNIPLSELVCDNSTDNTPGDGYEVEMDALYSKGQLIGAGIGCFVFGVVSSLVAYFVLILVRKARGRPTAEDSPIVGMVERPE
ncbi:leucine-rich repeat and transmembrane domain-containing protein 1-like isoform X1 [Ptychodera flava]|uniref:leucine-rich repeat and transmembrane domain-containing protein 1-like isoform X1 n=1 Tax=Ptychodera flava TaxID=63121 RepID=UPI00396A7C69